MTEKNYDPDNDHCPEKDTVENLHQSKGKNNTTKTIEEFTDDDSNHLSSDKVKDLKQKSDTKK
ncbi:hypothetical protein [Flavobacterium sp. ENC]|uniref:hypothetical protein n=1 Tax=Flavobacterium sp. ENC TaxID=2897330 RepID=UPI001E4E98D4|nr:hypothetical protein [Flavobacterium sp. ENC]MCD0464935.1 hypothetical protein [Flavobacterium sp. ENC]